MGEVTEDVLSDCADWNACISEVVARDRLPGIRVIEGDRNLGSIRKDKTLREIAGALEVCGHLIAVSQEICFVETLLGKEEECLVFSVVNMRNDHWAAD